MPKKPFWESDKPADITVPKPLERHLTSIPRHTQATPKLVNKSANNRLSFSDNLSQLYELWEAQRAELQASAEPLPKRIEALGRLARVLPQLQVAERLHKAKRGDKAIDEMSDEELEAMLLKESKE